MNSKKLLGILENNRKTSTYTSSTGGFKKQISKWRIYRKKVTECVVIGECKDDYKYYRVNDKYEIQHYANKNLFYGTKQECENALNDKLTHENDIEIALNKQIPMLPNIEGDGCDNDGNIIYDTWICPNCGKNYEIDYDIYKYCPNCGQAIDRSELEEE